MDAEIKIEGYHPPFRGDRKKNKSRSSRDSGGVAIYVRDDAAIDTEEILSFSNGLVETVGIHIKGWNLVVFVVYRTPDDPTHNRHSGHRELSQALKAIEDCLQGLTTPTPDLIICGDFNLPNADWNRGECKPGSDRVREEDKMVRALYELTLNNFLVQEIRKPTHRDGNTLDLVFTNNAHLVHSYTSTYSSVSDHNIVEIKTHYKSTNQTDKTKEEDEPTSQVPSFFGLNFFSNEINWPRFNSELTSCNWIQEFKGCNANEMLNKFSRVCLEIATELVPAKKRPCKSQSRIPRHRRVLMRTRRRVNIQLSKHPCESRRKALTSKLVDIEKKLRQSHHDQQEMQEKKAVESIKSNSKYFFSYAKSFSKVKTGIGPLLDAANSLISNTKKMAEMLSDQYSSVFSHPKHQNNNPEELFPEQPAGPGSISNILFTEEELIEAMKEIRCNSASGPDEFPAMILKQCAHAIAPPLFMIWRNSLNTGIIPTICKTANIIPIHKGKSRAVPKNYRPVALTSLLIKLFEKVVRRHLVSYMEETCQFNPSQHGFRSGRSCLSQLLEHFDHITRLLEEGQSVDIIYLDFAKAFDKVDIGVTLRKLKTLGITGTLGRWLHCFLTGRSQTVIVNGTKSSPRTVVSGVPQGSVLGPLLFLILIGDIDEGVTSSFISSFADDTRIGHGVTSQEDIIALKRDLQSVYEWAKTNNMEFNSDKFELLRYHHNSSTQIEASYTADNGSPIEEKEALKDLGVIMSSNGSFSHYIMEKVTKMKSKIGWVLRTFRTRELRPMLTLWKQLILSDHDYCSQLWSPVKVGDIQSLEMLQRSFLRRICGMQELSYWEQLKKLKLYSLERRRERYIAIYVWRIIEGNAPNISATHGITAQSHPRRGRTCRVPNVSPSATCRIKSIRHSSFAIKGPRIFNSLPKDVRNFTGGTVDEFKRKLDYHLQTVPDEPLIPGYTAFRTIDSNSLIDWHTHLVLHRRDTSVEDSRHSGDANLQSLRVDPPGSP